MSSLIVPTINCDIANYLKGKQTVERIDESVRWLGIGKGFDHLTGSTGLVYRVGYVIINCDIATVLNDGSGL